MGCFFGTRVGDFRGGGLSYVLLMSIDWVVSQWRVGASIASEPPPSRDDVLRHLERSSKRKLRPLSMVIVHIVGVGGDGTGHGGRRRSRTTGLQWSSRRYDGQSRRNAIATGCGRLHNGWCSGAHGSVGVRWPLIVRCASWRRRTGATARGASHRGC